MGISIESFKKRIEELINKKVKVSGNVQISISNDLNRVLIEAEDEAKKMGDDYVSVEHLFILMLKYPGKALKELFKSYGITVESFLKVSR